MKLKNGESIPQQTKETVLDKIRKHTYPIYVASVLSLASFGSTLGLSSCNNNKEKVEEKLTIEIIPKDHRVDISGGNKILEIEGKSLKIGKETVAILNKECQIRIEYENSQSVNPEPLIGKFLEKPGKIIIYIIPFDVPDPENAFKYAITDYLILYTNQETLITGLDNLKNVPFRVGESTNLMNYIYLNDVSLEEITVKYPDKNEPTKIDNPYNFVPENQGQGLDLKIYVIKKGKTYKCITEINILPKKREPIGSTIENSSSEKIPPIKNINSNNNYQYFQDSKATIGRQMIQAMSHNGTLTHSPNEYKNHLNKVVYIIPGKKVNGSNENTYEGEHKTANEHITAKDKMIKTRIPNAKLKTISEENDISLQSQIIKYAQSHPEEIIIAYNPQNNDEENETNNKTQIKDFQGLNNVVIIEGTNDSDRINSIILGMIIQLDPEIKNAYDLLEIAHYPPSEDNINNGEQHNSSSIINLGGSINKILPKHLSFNIDFSNKEIGRYKLTKGEYPLIIFDIPGSMMKINNEWIPCNKENGYILKNTNIASCERCIDKEELIKLGYKSCDNIKGNVILLDEHGKKLNINVPIAIQLKWK